MLECYRCEHKWKQRADYIRKNKLPIACPKCKSPSWNIKLNQKCEICNRLIFYPILHHIDGNHRNNKNENKIVICEDCHLAIHQGIGRQNRNARCGRSKRRNYGNWRGWRGETETIKKIEFYQTKLK